MPRSSDRKPGFPAPENGTTSRLRLVGPAGEPRRPAVEVPAPPRVIALASAKGGVGRSHLALNLAVALAGQGRPTILADADFGLRQQTLLSGIDPTHDLGHVLKGLRGPGEVAIEGPGGVRILPGPVSLSTADLADPELPERVLDVIAEFAGPGDVVLLDLPSGVHPASLRLAAGAGEVLLVITPDVTSWTEARNLQRRLAEFEPGPLGVLVNRVGSIQEAADAFTRMVTASGEIPAYWGYVPEDPIVAEAGRRGRPFVLLAPNAPASRQVGKLARRILEEPVPKSRRSSSTLSLRRPDAAAVPVQESRLNPS